MYGSNEDSAPLDHDQDLRDNDQYRIEKSEIYDEPESVRKGVSVDDINTEGFDCCLRQLISGDNSEHFVDFKYAMMNETHDDAYILELVRSMRDELNKSFTRYYGQDEPRFRVY